MAGYLILFALLVLLWFLIAHSSGNPSFWKATRNYPGIAWTFFNSHPAWHLYVKPLHIKVVGPFHVKDPVTGEMVKLYCEDGQLESSQIFFMQMIKSIKSS